MLSPHVRMIFTSLACVTVLGLASFVMVGCEESPSSATASSGNASAEHGFGASSGAENTSSQNVQPLFFWPSDPESGKLLQVGKYPVDLEENPSLWQISNFPESEVPAYNIDPLDVRMVQTSEVERMIDSGGWMLVDVRKDKDLAVKGTIPGAQHYEYKHEGALLSGSTKLSAEAIEDLFEIAPRGVIIFCNGGKCPRSFNACVALVQEWGLQGNKIVWFRGGAPAWDRSPLLLIKTDTDTGTN